MTTQILSSEYTVHITPKQSITIVRNGHEPNTFKIGDWAEYDSYNLSYSGIIRSITEKTVTIEAYPNSTMSRKHRLKLDTFAWRNYNFSKEKCDAHNSNEMMYI